MPGSVLYLGTNQVAVVAALFGAAYAGRPFVPVNYRLKQEELGYLLRWILPSAMIVDEELSPKLKAAATATQATGTVIQSSFRPPGCDRGLIHGPMDPEAAALHLFTSGTASEPRAAIITHGNLFQYVVDTADAASASPEEAVLVSTPPYHIAAVAGILSNVFRCRRLVLMPQFDGLSWLQLASRESVTHAMVVPTMLSRILDVLEQDPTLWPKSLVNLSYGGSKPPTGLIERAMQRLPASVGLINAFGLTETASTVCVLTPTDHLQAFASEIPRVRARLNSVGRPVPGVELRVVRPDGCAAEPDEEGEVWVHGSHVSPGYVSGATQVDAAGWLHTGDLGCLDGDGYLFIRGRQDDVIIRGGENIDPVEIEQVLSRHPAVHEAVVVGLPDPDWGQVIAALVVGDGTVGEDDLKNWVHTRLAGYKVPVHIRWVDSLPRNDLGKLIRRQAATMF